MSAGQIAEMGNIITLGPRGGVIRSIRTGKKTPIHRRNGHYIIDLWVKLPEEGPSKEQETGFHRPGPA